MLKCHIESRSIRRVVGCNFITKKNASNIRCHSNLLTDLTFTSSFQNQHVGSQKSSSFEGQNVVIPFDFRTVRLSHRKFSRRESKREGFEGPYLHIVLRGTQIAWAI